MVKVESYRSSQTHRANAGRLFSRWGISTAESLSICHAELPSVTLIASGGLRHGLDERLQHLGPTLLPWLCLF